MKLLNFPVPVFAGVASFQVPDGLMEGAPGWFMGFATAVFVIVYVLEKTGRLPRKNGSERRRADFTENDRGALEVIGDQTKKITDLLASRDDAGFERFLKMNERVEELHKDLEGLPALLAKLAELQEQQTQHMAVLSADIRRRA